MKKSMLGVIVAICITIACVIGNCIPVSAGAYMDTCGRQYVLYSRNLVYQEKVSEHEVTMAESGLPAMCYVYKYYYDEVWICPICGAKKTENTFSIKHSICGN